MTTGLYIVRGQPPHNGHLHVIKEMMQKECDEIIIGVGSAEEKHTKRNPLAGGERVHIFNRLLAAELDKPYSVIPIVDLKNPPKYARYVERIAPPFDIVYANEDTAPLFEARGYETRSWNRIHNGLSASSIRERIGSDDGSWVNDVHPIVYQELMNLDAVNRIRGIMQGSLDTPESVVHRNPTLTVDAIIHYHGKPKLVLIERGKEPFKGMWALPGGHLESGFNVDDHEKLIEAAKREVREETGLVLHNIRYLKYADGPGRDPRGHYITHVFAAEGYGDLVAGDDAKNVQVFGFNELPELAFDHGKILEEYLNEWYKGYDEGF